MQVAAIPLIKEKLLVLKLLQVFSENLLSCQNVQAKGCLVLF